ncbi:MAG: hypothetical protein HYY20_09320 [Candidatus Tectomicrobia bacterium]|uniref:Uncharacterized protein n=1 Tax=Tectimicrobiota bacterium TaxID=2528274 RepID=A0A932CPS0_UNCTE|nr:hypothetical protein [Candidatus Tectomicrobia bacterium]
MNEKVMDIMVAKMPFLLTEDYFDAAPLTCYRCATIDLFWDEIRKRLGGREIVMPKDKQRQA